MIDFNGFKTLSNGRSAALSDVPFHASVTFFALVARELAQGARLLSFFGAAQPGKAAPQLFAVLGDDSRGCMAVCRTEIIDASYPSLTPAAPQAHLFEREIFEQFGITPQGHPWLKPVRFPSGKDKAPIGITRYYSIEGEEIHEVGVGPVHAGVIEPGHFRFECFGEQVLHLEISLGYQHRGVEEALIGGPYKHSWTQLEAAAGDTTAGHAWAYAMNLEALSGVIASPRSQLIRALALELERLANHTGDLGALAGDVGFLPTLSYCGRLRGDFLNMTALLCGNRFSRSLLCPGGVRFDIDSALAGELSKRLAKTWKDVDGAVSLIWDTSAVSARFEHTGTVTEEQCRSAGLVGVAARACGVERDVRFNHPWGPYRFLVVPPATVPGGDVNARALTRFLEMRRSKEFIESCLGNLPQGELRKNMGRLGSDRLAVSLVEGWRGEVCHVAITGADGKFLRYKVTDPSFHNWFGLALALRGQQFSDFPLCNKSFNLSYCGYDL